MPGALGRRRNGSAPSIVLYPVTGDDVRFTAIRQRPNPWVILAIVLLHIAVFFVLIRALAPQAVESVRREVLAVFDVTDPPPPPPPPPPQVEPQPDEGAQGDPGREAVPKPVTAPEPKTVIRTPQPAPPASSTGSANSAGATGSGTGTGAAGSGTGTGAGGSGSGQGGGQPVTKPRLLRDIRDAGAFPVPPGGRAARIGKSVIVRLDVSAAGRATACSVYRPSPFPETDAAVCRLAIEQTRFEPARNRDGEAVASVFYYQQRFFN